VSCIKNRYASPACKQQGKESPCYVARGSHLFYADAMGADTVDADEVPPALQQPETNRSM